MVEKQTTKQKYIIVGGGVASGIGKGLTISSIGYILQQSGYNVSVIKVDPYLNIDAGLMAPREHGECYTLNDGGEVDLDLGTYERALNISLSYEHSITSGKIFQQVLHKERNGKYLGKTVQFIPHVTDHIQEYILRVSKINISNDPEQMEQEQPDIVLVELGGTVGIGLVGKYIGLNNFGDVYLSVLRALESSATVANMRIKILFIDPHILDDEQKLWKDIKKCQGILFPGGFDIRGFEGSVKVVQYARENNIPALGICLGFQTMVIEFCRNLLKIDDASSQEFCYKKPSKNLVIVDMSDALSEIRGQSMRLGSKETKLDKNYKVYKIYGKEVIFERYRHRYEFNQEFRDRVEEKGMKFTGFDTTGKRMEVLELSDHKFFMGVQFHPEFKSKNFQPSPIYLAFMYAIHNKLDKALEKFEAGKGISQLAYNKEF